MVEPYGSLEVALGWLAGPEARAYGVTVMKAFEVVVIFPTGVVALSETL